MLREAARSLEGADEPIADALMFNDIGRLRIAIATYEGTLPVCLCVWCCACVCVCVCVCVFVSVDVSAINRPLVQASSRRCR